MRTESSERGPISKPDSGGFVWPPRDSSGPPNAAEPVTHEPQPSFMHTMLESIETDLLGRTTLAFDLWAQRTGWTPDAPEAYCWRCAGSVGPHEVDGEGCADCRAKTLPWDRALRLGTYRDDLRDEVIALKFNRWRPGGRGLGEFLGNMLTEQMQRAQLTPEQVRLVPIPTHPIRRITRGVDHTQVLARAAAEASGCRVSRALRARYRPEQVGLSATARAANIRNAFEPRSRVQREGVRVWVLIDDVRTTGATFVAASKALRRAISGRGETGEKSEIWICSVAVSGARSRRDLTDDR